MSLDNEHDEKPQWYLQLEQERQKLSASVAEALADTQIQDDDWEEEEEQMNARVETADKTTVIPPRLSLQSKVLPTVQAQGIEASVQKRAVVPTSSSASMSTLDDEHKDSVFVRLARRLTSSFSTFGVSMPSEGADVPTKPIIPARSQHPQGERLPMIPGAMPPERVTNPPQLRSGQPSHVVDAVPLTPIRSLPASHETSLPEGKRRLARTTRVRLETAPVLTTTTVSSAETGNTAPMPPLKPHRTEETMRETRQDTSANMALSYDTHDTYDKARETSVKLPAVTMSPYTENSLPILTPQKQFFGCAMFASGQSDKMVEDSNVTEKCIVLVMLTGNPGPVVVHYVSLYPGTGFTVHLTAPADKEATFNYVILANEQG